MRRISIFRELNVGIFKKVTPVAAIIAVLVSLLPAATPVYASAATRTWNTQAAFDNATVLTNVDTSSSPGDVVLAAGVDKGNGSYGDLRPKQNHAQLD